MSSSERKGARWIIFFCMTCVVMGPVLHMLAWMGGIVDAEQIGLEQHPQWRFTARPLRCTLMGFLFDDRQLSLRQGLYKLSFWYYLLTVCIVHGGWTGSRRSSGCFSPRFSRNEPGLHGVVAFSANLHQNQFNDLAPWVAVGFGRRFGLLGGDDRGREDRDRTDDVARSSRSRCASRPAARPQFELAGS